MHNSRLTLKIAAVLLAAGAVVGAVSQADAKLATNLIGLNGLSQVALNEQGGYLNGIHVRGIILPTR